MTKEVYMDIYGLEFVVTVEYEDNAVCGVECVYALMKNGTPVALKCSTNDFYKAFDGFLQEALEKALEDEKIAEYEMRMDAKREEGKI